MCLAAHKGHIAIVQLLLARDDVEVNCEDRHGRTPLWRATWEGHEAIVGLMQELDDVWKAN
jgi:ankyrin repeat protein